MTDYNKYEDYHEGYVNGLNDGAKIAYDLCKKNEYSYKLCKKSFRNWLNLVMLGTTALCFTLFHVFGTNGLVERLGVTSSTPYKTSTKLDILLEVVVLINAIYGITVDYITNKTKRGI